MNTVQELRQSQQDSDSQGAKECTQAISKNKSDTVERGDITKTTGNRSILIFWFFPLPNKWLAHPTIYSLNLLELVNESSSSDEAIFLSDFAEQNGKPSKVIDIDRSKK